MPANIGPLIPCASIFIDKSDISTQLNGQLRLKKDPNRAPFLHKYTNNAQPLNNFLQNPNWHEDNILFYNFRKNKN